jgi:UDP-3-O-[3-hydroxymyristoyl] glucosamine N-acyltransferase
MTLSCRALRIPPELVLVLELYTAESLEAGTGSIYRAVLAEGDVELGRRCMVLRWLHAGRSLRTGAGCALHGRLSADEAILLEPDCVFERLNAPRIDFGTPVSLDLHRGETELIEADDLPRVVDVSAGRWLIKRRLELPARRRVESDVVVTGSALIGEGARIIGSIKSHKDLVLERGVVVEGSVVSGRTVHLSEGCRIHGPVLAEKNIHMARGCVIGTADKPTTISARRIQVEAGVATHGTVWAHEGGLLAASEEAAGAAHGTA